MGRKEDEKIAPHCDFIHVPEHTEKFRQLLKLVSLGHHVHDLLYHLLVDVDKITAGRHPHL